MNKDITVYFLFTFFFDKSFFKKKAENYWPMFHFFFNYFENKNQEYLLIYYAEKRF